MATGGAVRRIFPPIKLDMTLHDLLQQDLRPGELMPAHCSVKSHSDPAFGEAVPLSSKYIIHCAQVGNPDDLAHLQLEICTFLLNFGAGPMKVVMLAAESNTRDPTLNQQFVELNAIESFSVLHETQRPQILCFKNKDDFVARQDGTPVRYSFAMDWSELAPTAFDPELIYKLNSKRWLAKAIGETAGDMAAPNDVLIDTPSLCPYHTTSEGHWYNGSAEQGQRRRRSSLTISHHAAEECDNCINGIKEEIHRVREILEERPLPYVLKLTQSLSSVGTNLVRTEKDRTDTIRKITRTLLEYLPRITMANAHLYTMSLVMSDFIPGKTMALNFFVRRDGSCHFLGACHQLSTGMTGRQNTAITYNEQEQLEKKYKPTLDKMCALLHKEGYWGQVGVDIMEDEQGEQYIIDANVRQALSCILYPLKGHFTSRGLNMSMVFECLFLRISRAELEEKFAKEFSEGRIIIMGSTKFGKRSVWGYGVIIGGESQKQMSELSERICEYETRAHVAE